MNKELYVFLKIENSLFETAEDFLVFLNNYPGIQGNYSLLSIADEVRKEESQ